MTAFVLVHGGFHGSWCWEPVIKPLRSAGHRVEAVDMPGRPGGPMRSCIDLASYGEAVAAAIDRVGEPVVLAVHSAGGVAASLAVQLRPEAISRLVFVNALLPNAGETALDIVARGGPDCVLLREGALLPSTDGATLSIDSPETAIDAFYNCCETSTAKEAAAKLVPEPLLPARQPLAVTAARFGVPKTYVGSKNDHCLSWALQQQMSEEYGARFVELDGDHSPFLSATDDLLTTLIEA